MTFPGGQFPTIPGEPKALEPIERALLAMSYGVHVIGSHSAGGELNAMLADWVMQVSFQPRLVACSIENDARTLRNVRETNVFTVNLLHEKDGEGIARKVVMPHHKGKIRGRRAETAAGIVDKMAGLDYALDGRGCPVLRQALGWYACEAEQFVETGDHTLVIGRVVEGDVVRSGEMLIERELGWEYGG